MSMTYTNVTLPLLTIMEGALEAHTQTGRYKYIIFYCVDMKVELPTMHSNNLFPKKVKTGFNICVL